jgi:hypothetical protein
LQQEKVIKELMDTLLSIASHLKKIEALVTDVKAKETDLVEKSYTCKKATLVKSYTCKKATLV